MGGPGFRVGRDAKGRTYRSASIPGTGISSRKYIDRKGTGSSTSRRSSRSLPEGKAIPWKERSLGDKIALIMLCSFFGLILFIVVGVIGWIL